MCLIVYGERVVASSARTGWLLAGELVENQGQPNGVVEDDAVGEQLVEVDDLLHVVGVVVADHPSVAEPSHSETLWKDSTRLVIVVMLSRSSGSER